MKNQGFTLIELIVVMAIIAVLVLLAAPRFLGYTKDAKVAVVAQDTKVLSDASEMYRINNGKWPIQNNSISDAIVLGIGGIDEIFPLNKELVSEEVKSIAGDFDDYGLVTKGEYRGKVFRLNGVKDKENNYNYGHIAQKIEPVVFQGKEYESDALIPDSPLEWFEYELVDNTYTIMGFKEGVRETEIKIPSTIDGKVVTSIENNAFRAKGIVGLILPKHIQSIGNGTFMENRIVRLNVPNSLDYLGEHSFKGNRIKALHLPSHMKEIKYAAFELNRLERLTLPKKLDKVGYNAFSYNLLPEKDAFIYGRNKYGMEDKTVLTSYGGKERDNVIIPNNVRVIVGGAFAWIPLKQIVIPDTVEKIYGDAFSYAGLTEVIIPETVQLMSPYTSFRSNGPGRNSGGIPTPGHWKIVSGDWVKQ